MQSLICEGIMIISIVVGRLSEIVIAVPYIVAQYTRLERFLRSLLRDSSSAEMSVLDA